MTESDYGRSFLDIVVEDGVSAEFLETLTNKIAASHANYEQKQPIMLLLRRTSEILNMTPLGRERWFLTGFYFRLLLLCTDQNQFVASTIKDPKRKEFYLKEWLPYLLKARNWIQIKFTEDPIVNYERFSISLSSSWKFQHIQPVEPWHVLNTFCSLDLICPIDLPTETKPIQKTRVLNPSQLSSNALNDSFLISKLHDPLSELDASFLDSAFEDDKTDLEDLEF